MWSRTSPLAIVLILLGLCSVPAAAQGAETLGSLRASLEERFTLVPLSDGLLLQPLAPDARPRAIEVSRAGIALDGDLVGGDELRLRLGDEAADLVESGAALDDDARRALLTVEPATELDVEEAADAAAEAAADAAAQAAEAAEGVAETVVAEVTRAAADAAKAEREAARARRAKKSSYRRSGDAEVAVGSSVTVAREEVTDDVLVMGGFLKVEGKVEGDATVIGGSATIEGEVTGDVTAVGGPVRLEAGSHVHGDVSSVGSRVYQDEGARVDGQVEQVPLNADFSFGPWKNWLDWKNESRSFDWHVNPWHWWTGLGWSLFKLIFVVVFSWLWLLLAPGPIDRMERRIEAEPWKTGLVGLLAQVLFIPLLVMLVIFLAISIIGIPLLLLLPFALVALFFVGWFGLVAVAGRVGSWARERFGWRLDSPYWVVLVGLVLIGALSIVGDLLDFGVAPMRFIAGMFMFFGAIVSWAAVTIGFGAAVLTRFGTAASWSRAESLVAPLPPLPDLGRSAGPPSAEGFDEPRGAGPEAPPEERG